MSAAADITLEEIIARIREVAPAIRAEGVNKLAIFGSRARGDARPDSDLDVLIEVRPEKPDRHHGDLRRRDGHTDASLHAQ
jgi:uncharacterized protein